MTARGLQYEYKYSMLYNPDWEERLGLLKLRNVSFDVVVALLLCYFMHIPL